MKAVCCLTVLLVIGAWADDNNASAPFVKVLETFNHTHERATVLAPGADLSDLARFRGQEVSQVYFKFKDVAYVTPEVVIVDAVATQFGSPGFMRTIPAAFVMKRTGSGWKIMLLRIASARSNPAYWE